MKRRLGKGWRLGLTSLEIFGLIALWGYSAVAQTTPVNQIQPDNTLGDESSDVNPDTIRGQLSDLIEGGAERGSNLFHSFQEFNVSEGQGAYFSNPDGIANILSRVTGGSRSEILGTLGVLGDANLFLVNPNGILFGPESSLDVGGSFVGTTANAIEFRDRGFFSATNPQPPQLLTVNPSAFLFNQMESGASIENRSVAPAGQHPAALALQGLRVADGKSLVLLGGNVTLDGGRLNAINGRIELGGLTELGTVDLDIDGNNLSLGFPENIARGNVSFNNARAYVFGSDQGEIAIEAHNLNIADLSQVIAGIWTGLGTEASQGGDIILDVENNTAISNSLVANVVLGTGDSGNTIIDTTNLSLSEQATIGIFNNGQGNLGNLIIDATNRVSLDSSSAENIIQSNGKGRGGSIKINTDSLSLNNISGINADTFGVGNAGNVSINAETITLNEASQIFSNVEENGVGNGGNVNITAESLTVTNGTQIGSSTRGKGDGGMVNINADIVLLEGLFRNGESILLSSIFSSVEQDAEGDGGTIDITTNSLSVANRAQIAVGTRGNGNAGSVIINADTVTFDNGALLSTVEAEDARGNGGNVKIGANRISVVNGSQLVGSTFGKGNAGTFIINADNVLLDGVRVSGAQEFRSAILSSVQGNALGNGNTIEINTENLSITNGARIDTSTRGKGNAGNIIINANYISLDGIVIIGEENFRSGIFSQVGMTGEGNGGEINLNTDDLEIANGAQTSAISIGQGIGGNTKIISNSVSLSNDGNIDSSSVFSNAGNITLDVPGTLESNDSDISTISFLSAGGKITIHAGNIQLSGDSDIETNVFIGTGDGGDITLTANSILAFDDSDILAFAQDGRGGNITLNTPAYFGSNFQAASLNADPDTLDGNGRADINATGAVSGVVTLPNVSFIQNSLFELPENAIDIASLIANSCVARSTDSESTFIITGGGGLPVRPGDAAVSPYTTGTVQMIPNEAPASNPAIENNWEKGDPIIEPQGVYRLPNGELVMSRECS